MGDYYNNILQMIERGYNPEQVMMNLLQARMGNTPMGQNLMRMVQTKDTSGIEAFARNICRENGVDFDIEFQAFRKRIGK